MDSDYNPVLYFIFYNKMCLFVTSTLHTEFANIVHFLNTLHHTATHFHLILNHKTEMCRRETVPTNRP
jgi:hypothetical protein